jgi:Raf kinase inhibitor-like YbhB/YbcL family protein
MRRHLLALLFLAAAPVTALADSPAASRPTAKQVKKTSLKVTSSAFAPNGAIPADYTCDGAQTSPPLAWSNVPKNARALAILVEDPDAPNGAFTHWLVTGIAPATTSLAAGAKLPEGAMAARNGKGDTGYSAPCPPGGRHRYFFHVYALDTTIPGPATKEDFLASIDGHVLAEGQLIGVYEKSGASREAPRPR